MKARPARAGERLEAAQIFFPEQAAQDGVGIQRQQFFARQRRGEVGDAVEGFVEADAIFVAHPREVARAFDRQALDQQPGGDAVVGGEHEARIELLALQHVVLQHLRELLQRLAPVAMERHHALVGLLAGALVLRIQRDRAAALAVQVDHGLEPRRRIDLANHLGGGAVGQVGLHLDHREPHRPVAEYLQHQRAVELDVGLHQRAGRGHLAEQGAHRCREGVARLLAAREQLLPRVGQAHQHAAHRQAFEEKLVQFRHRAQPIFFRPRRKRSAFCA